MEWEVVAIYNHLACVCGGDEAARKTDYLTAPTTLPSAITHMRENWDSGFPAYTSAPRKVLRRAALIAY